MCITGFSLSHKVSQKCQSSEAHGEAVVLLKEPGSDTQDAALALSRTKNSATAGLGCKRLSSGFSMMAENCSSSLKIGALWGQRLCRLGRSHEILKSPFMSDPGGAIASPFSEAGKLAHGDAKRPLHRDQSRHRDKKPLSFRSTALLETPYRHSTNNSTTPEWHVDMPGTET